FLARGGCVALGAVEHAMVLVAETGVRQPAGRDVRLLEEGQAVAVALTLLREMTVVAAVVEQLSLNTLELVGSEKHALERAELPLDPLPLRARRPLAEHPLVDEAVRRGFLVGGDRESLHKRQKP